uniref:Glycosyl transferase, family 9 n=1 Tax=Leptospirillum ferrodiazotrophum TaxID=412449 RepID=C6I026_9BACT|nr:MAG: glycosyl transferase, family 9 [Leptospirillum ferrodiazotrophum]
MSPLPASQPSELSLPIEGEGHSPVFLARDLAEKTLVVLKFSGWGTLLGMAPLLAGLRQWLPSTRIVFATLRPNAMVAERLPGADRIVYLDDLSPGGAVSLRALLSLTRDLRRERPALFLDLQLHTCRRTSLFLALATGASRRVGFVRTGDLVRMRGLTDPLYHNRAHPSRLAYEQAALLFGDPALVDTRAAMAPLLEETPLDRGEIPPQIFSQPHRILVINPNASPRSLERRWPRENFARTAEALLRAHPSLRIVLTGAAGERAETDRIASALPLDLQNRVLNLAGSLSFGALVSLLRRADVFLTNDSGPLHLALHLGTPTVGLFGPTRPDPAGDPDHYPNFSPLFEPHYCSPCLYQAPRPPCGGDNVCLASLSVERVVREVERYLARGRSWKASPSAGEMRTTGARGAPLARFTPPASDIR